MNTPAQGVRVLGFRPAAGSVFFTQLFKPYMFRFVVGLLFLLMTNIVTLIVPRLINIGVQLVEGQAPDSFLRFSGLRLDIPTITSLVVVLCVLAVVGAITRTMSRQVVFNVGRDIERDLRSKLFYHLSLLSSGFYARRSVGDLMSHLTSDVNNIRMFTGFAALNLLNIIIIFSGTVPILLSIDWVVALAALAPFVLVILGAQGMTGRMFQRVREHQAALSQLTAHVQENLSGAQIVRVFHQEAAEEKKFAQTNENTFQAAMRLAKIRVVMFPLMRMMGGLGIAVALFVGGREVALGHISVGDYVEINARLLQLAWPAISIGFILSIYSQGRASLARINDLLIERPEIVDGPYESADLNRVDVKALDVSVGIQRKLVLQNVNFQMMPGQVLGVVGPSGSGKSTLLRALSRELAVSRQQIFFSGVDALDWNLLCLHRHIAVVSSDPFLFSASLRENIAFARTDASDAEIAEVIDQVGLTRDMGSFADGLNTLVGERGVMLSGGQRQRIALARALLSRASMLLLDDCLSAVDSETESQIVRILREQNRAHFLVIVSHRLSAVRHADEILVFDQGRIVERGRHGELLQRKTLYAALWGVEQLHESLTHG